MSFTNEELKEIEKVFDIQAGRIAEQHARFISIFSTLKTQEAEQHLQKLFNEYVNTFNTYRTISVKASRMQAKEGGQE